MPMYAVVITTLIYRLIEEKLWFADDASAIEKLRAGSKQ